MLYRDNGKENGNYYIVYWGYIGVLEVLYRDHGKQNGNYHIVLNGVCLEVQRLL